MKIKNITHHIIWVLNPIKNTLVSILVDVNYEVWNGNFHSL